MEWHNDGSFSFAEAAFFNPKVAPSYYAITVSPYIYKKTL
jgi:hypothetical protein